MNKQKKYLRLESGEVLLVEQYKNEVVILPVFDRQRRIEEPIDLINWMISNNDLTECERDGSDLKIGIPDCFQFDVEGHAFLCSTKDEGVYQVIGCYGGKFCTFEYTKTQVEIRLESKTWVNVREVNPLDLSKFPSA